MPGPWAAGQVEEPPDQTYIKTERARCVHNAAVATGGRPCATNSADRNRRFLSGDSHVPCAAPRKAPKYNPRSPTPKSAHCGLARRSAPRTNALLAAAGLGASSTTLHFLGDRRGRTPTPKRVIPRSGAGHTSCGGRAINNCVERQRFTSSAAPSELRRCPFVVRVRCRRHSQGLPSCIEV